MAEEPETPDTPLQPEILYEPEGSVARITINRPDKRNSLSATAITALDDAYARAGRDRTIRSVVLTGAGERAFCSGADLSSMFSEETPDGDGTNSDPGGTNAPEAGPDPMVGGHEARGKLARLFQTIWDLGKPSIARVRGYCLAGGFGLAMACDLVIASDDSVFGTPEVKVGLWPYMITVPMLRSMPPKVALDLMMTGRRVPAEEALRLGFVNRVVPAAQLDQAVAETAAAIAAGSPDAIKLGRTAFYRCLSMGPSEALDYLQAMLTVTTMTGDAQEGIASFLEGRPPRWSR
ncbi:MAG TPA: enoyl-CoA hydratase-related protein [Acidimicrobiales bacterium]|nr:enoyl-CoA hydratase-related protein [Acidimicrobiales bacterium]